MQLIIWRSIFIISIHLLRLHLLYKWGHLFIAQYEWTLHDNATLFITLFSHYKNQVIFKVLLFQCYCWIFSFIVLSCKPYQFYYYFVSNQNNFTFVIFTFPLYLWMFLKCWSKCNRFPSIVYGWCSYSSVEWMLYYH